MTEPIGEGAAEREGLSTRRRSGCSRSTPGKPWSEATGSAGLSGAGAAATRLRRVSTSEMEWLAVEAAHRRFTGTSQRATAFLQPSSRSSQPTSWVDPGGARSLPDGMQDPFDLRSESAACLRSHPFPSPVAANAGNQEDDPLARSRRPRRARRGRARYHDHASLVPRVPMRRRRGYCQNVIEVGAERSRPTTPSPSSGGRRMRICSSASTPPRRHEHWSPKIRRASSTSPRRFRR